MHSHRSWSHCVQSTTGIQSRTFTIKLAVGKPEGLGRRTRLLRGAADQRTALASSEYGGISPPTRVGNWLGAILELGRISPELELQLASFSHS